MNIYQNTKSCVVVNNVQSDYFMCTVGVRQGENLSPLLFSLFLNDLEQFFILNGNSSLKLDPDLCTQYLQLFVLMYADDTVLLANTSEGLQKGLSDLQKYCELWDIKVNEQKIKIVIFGQGRTRKNANIVKFYYKNRELEIVDNFKYLGILFSENGIFLQGRQYYHKAQGRCCHGLRQSAVG